VGVWGGRLVGEEYNDPKIKNSKVFFKGKPNIFIMQMSIHGKSRMPNNAIN